MDFKPVPKRDRYKYKIFMGLTEIAGYYSNLKKGFQEIGVECAFVNLSYHPFEYGGDDEPNIFVRAYKLNHGLLKKYDHKFLKIPFFTLAYMIKIFIFIWAFYNYDIFIFGSGRSFFNYFDLPLLSLFNKKIVFTFNGSDGRPPYINGARQIHTLEYYKNLSQRIKLNIVTIEKYADVIITQPAISHFHKKKIGNFISIGHPFNSDHSNCTQNFNSDHSNCTQSSTKKEIVILHSPSDPIGKGSTQIRAAINDLKLRGHNIKFIEITGKPHREVIRILEKCDFIVDQVYSDLPMSGFATEAAWFGKPAVIGGYYVNYIHSDCLPEHIPPSLYCHPNEIISAIERLIVNEEYRRELGRRAQEFIKTQRTPKQVAKRYLQMIEGTIPEEFMFDPSTICYVQGYGMSESQSKEIIRKMVEQYGIEVLCLSDKPELEQRFKEYAYDAGE